MNAATHEKQTPLRLTIGVECARRGWRFSDLIRELGALGIEVARVSMDQRVDKAVPTKETLELVSKAFGLSFDDLLGMVIAETKTALDKGLSVGDEVSYMESYPTKTVWRYEREAK